MVQRHRGLPATHRSGAQQHLHLPLPSLPLLWQCCDQQEGAGICRLGSSLHRKRQNKIQYPSDSTRADVRPSIPKASTPSPLGNCCQWPCSCPSPGPARATQQGILQLENRHCCAPPPSLAPPFCPRSSGVTLKRFAQKFTASRIADTNTASLGISRASLELPRGIMLGVQWGHRSAPSLSPKCSQGLFPTCCVQC